jgi:hypothetical protein
MPPGEPVVPGKWMPIATAPRVDSWELREMRAVGAWKHRGYGWLWGQLEWHNNKYHEDGGYYMAAYNEPTLWMILPDPGGSNG